MIIVLLGPPGAGKGAQAEMLETRYRLMSLSTGDLLRDVVAAGGPQAETVKAIMDSGEPVPDDVVLGLLQDAMKAQEGEAGTILDGFPRTVPQAEALDALLTRDGLRVDAVIAIQVPDDVVVKRITGRFACAGCGATYHDVFKPTLTPGICDDCGYTGFTRRSDDNEETVRNRLAAYRAKTEPIIPYYRERGLLHTIDGTPPPDDVFEAITAVLDPLVGR